MIESSVVLPQPDGPTSSSNSSGHTSRSAPRNARTAAVPRPASKYGYDSVRGPIRLIAGNSFSVERVYHGFVPRWAGLEKFKRQ